MLISGAVMIEKPDFILNFHKPENTEIKHIRGHWYLYERHNKYDPSIKRSRKVSGKCLGKITAQGLIPTKRRLVNIEQKPQISDVIEVGSSVFFYESVCRNSFLTCGDKFMSSVSSVPCTIRVLEGYFCIMKTASLPICFRI